jgi:hypothetical protein
MARPSPIPTPEPEGSAPVYFLTIPEMAYKALSDAAAKKNLTLAQLVAKALSEYLKNEGV